MIYREKIKQHFFQQFCFHFERAIFLLTPFPVRIRKGGKNSNVWSSYFEANQIRKQIIYIQFNRSLTKVFLLQILVRHLRTARHDFVLKFELIEKILFMLLNL